MLYTTLSSLKTKLGIATDNTDSDSELSLIITEATNLIDTELGINLKIQEKTERIDGNGNNKLYLKYKPNEITSISDKNGYITYVLDYIDGYIIYTEENLPKGKKNILVEYEIGFDIVPKDIENICLDICFVLADRQNIKAPNLTKLINKNIQTQKLGNLGVTYFGENTKKKSSFEILDPNSQIQKVLNKYKPFIGLY